MRKGTILLVIWSISMLERVEMGSGWIWSKSAFATQPLTDWRILYFRLVLSKLVHQHVNQLPNVNRIGCLHCVSRLKNITQCQHGGHGARNTLPLRRHLFQLLLLPLIQNLGFGMASESARFSFTSFLTGGTFLPDPARPYFGSLPPVKLPGPHTGPRTVPSDK